MENSMEGIKRILAAIDFSQYSPQVLRFAVDLTQELKAQLVVVNVLNQRDVQAIEMVQREFPGQSVSQFVKAATAERVNLFEKLLAAAGAASVGAKKLIKVGVPFKEILNAVDEEQADLLIMGTKGRGNVADALFGSTAEKVFRRCPIPLVSVRPEGHFRKPA
jgi:nucleotide-binding universal stress UspA family protein